VAPVFFRWTTWIFLFFFFSFPGSGARGGRKCVPGTRLIFLELTPALLRPADQGIDMRLRPTGVLPPFSCTPNRNCGRVVPPFFGAPSSNHGCYLLLPPCDQAFLPFFFPFAKRACAARAPQVPVSDNSRLSVLITDVPASAHIGQDFLFFSLPFPFLKHLF